MAGHDCADNAAPFYEPASDLTCDFCMKLDFFEAVIFDLDGTLIDTVGDFVLALNRMLTLLPLPAGTPTTVSRDTVEQLIGKGSEHLIRSLLSQVLTQAGQTLPAAAFEALQAPAWDHYQAHYLAINGQQAEVYPGVLACLEGLQARGMPMACVTNKPTAFALPLLKAKGLDRFFSLVFGGDAFARKKPDPLPLLKTCEALGASPSRTLMVGDSSNDAQAARAAGCPVVLVTYGYNHGQPVHTVDADGVTDSLENLLAP